MNNNIFWIYNIDILWKNNNYLVLLPIDGMNKQEKYNAITRLLIYHILLLLILKLDYKYVYLDIILIITIIYINISDNNKYLNSTIDDPYMNKKMYNQHNMLNNFTYDANYNINDVINNNYNDRNYYTFNDNDNNIYKYKNVNKNCKYDNNDCMIYSDIRYHTSR